MRDLTKWQRKRRALSGLIGGFIVFVMLFTIGTGFFVFVNQENGAYDKSLAQRAAAMQDQISENLQVSAAAGVSNHLTVSVNNIGGVSVNVTDMMIVDPGTTLHTYGLGFASNTVPPLPVGVNVGAASPSFDTALVIVPGSYTIKVLTSGGDAFVTTYPPTPLTSTGGSALLVQMIATPPQALSGATVTDTVTVSNYASSPVTGITLQPTPPLASVTGTATLTGGACAPASIASIAAYSGSGNPTSATFTCTYTAETGSSGGLGSFSGYAQGILNAAVIASPEAISNTVQIGSSANVINQGPFSINAFFFKVSSCTNAPTSQSGYGPPFQYSSPCTTSPSVMPPANPNALLQGSLISGGSNYYVAFYVQITNNLNATLAITEYTYVFLDPTNGGESAYYLVGTATNPQTTYYPNYVSTSGNHYIPTLTAYTANQNTCAESPPNYNPPPPTSCIDIAPGQSETLTFAACGFGASNWSWGGTQYATTFDSWAGCTTNPPWFGVPEGTYLSIIISYVYKGVDYTEAIPFQGEIILQ